MWLNINGPFDKINFRTSFGNNTKKDANESQKLMPIIIGVSMPRFLKFRK